MDYSVDKKYVDDTGSVAVNTKHRAEKSRKKS